MKKWVFSPDEEKFAQEVLNGFTNKKGFILYEKLKSENPALYQNVNNGRTHIQLQQAFSRFRAKVGKNLVGHGKSSLKKPSKATIVRHVPSVQIKPKFEMNCCPNCGANLKAAQVGLNMPIE